MLSSTIRQQPWLSSASSFLRPRSTVHGTSDPSLLRGGLLLAALRSSRLLTGQSPHNAESRFRMEQEAIYDFLGEIQIENYRARDEEDDLWILQILEGPQDEANLNDCLCLSGDLPSNPLPDPDANGHNKTEPRKSGPRGTRKRRTSPWNPMFFARHVSRKNNSRWTAKEVERLVQGVSKLGVGRWTKLKQKFFKTSIRTAVNLKDKWRNLVKAYEENSQQTTQLDVGPSLVERIKKLVAKQPYANKRHR